MFFRDMIRADTKRVAVFVVFALALWYASTTVTDNRIVQAAILLGVGVIIPTVVNEIRG